MKTDDPSSKPPIGPPDLSDAEARLAAALRANLRRRKAKTLGRPPPEDR